MWVKNVKRHRNAVKMWAICYVTAATVAAALPCWNQLEILMREREREITLSLPEWCNMAIRHKEKTNQKRKKLRGVLYYTTYQNVV